MADHPLDSRGPRRSGGRPDPADLRQLSDSPVSLRRIARLFAPHRATLAVVVALIVLSSAVSLAQPFLVRHVIDVALPAPGRTPAGAVRRRDAGRRGGERRDRRRADLALHRGRPARHAPPAQRPLRPPPAPVAGLLHPHPRRRGPVAPGQRHRQHAGRRHPDRHRRRGQPHRRHRHRGGDGGPQLAPRAAVARRAPARRPAHPAGRADAPQGHRRAAAPAGRPARPDRGGPLGERRAAHQDPRRLTPADRAGSTRPRPTWSASRSGPGSPVAGGWPR